MKRTRSMGLSRSVWFVGIALTCSALTLAQQRSVATRGDLSGIPNREGVVLNVQLSAGVTSPKHFHPGDEFIHVLEGTVVVAIEGRPEVTLTTGQTIHIPAGAVHTGRNPSSTIAAKVMTFGVFEKGKPDMTVVQ